MDTLLTNEIFQDPEISCPTTDVECKNQNWFITYFDSEWVSEEDAEGALKWIGDALWNIKGKKGKDGSEASRKLVNALVNAEICPETGRLHFHIAASFVHMFRPLPSLKKLFPGGHIRAVSAKGVDAVKEYCSKSETRVGDTEIVAGSAGEIEMLRRKYVGKWNGRAVKKDSVATALAKELRLKQGRKNDRERLAVIKERETRIASHQETMKKIFGKVGQKERWLMLGNEIKMCQDEIERLNALPPGTPIFGEGEEEVKDEENKEWPDVEEEGEGELKPYDEPGESWSYYCKLDNGWCVKHRFNWRGCRPKEELGGMDVVLTELLERINAMLKKLKNGEEVDSPDFRTDDDTLVRMKLELLTELQRRNDVWRKENGLPPMNAWLIRRPLGVVKT